MEIDVFWRASGPRVSIRKLIGIMVLERHKNAFCANYSFSKIVHVWRWWCCVGLRKRVYCSLQAYCTYPMCVHCSHFHHQEAPRHNNAGDPSSEMLTLLGEKLPVIWPKVASSTLLYGSFTCRKSTTWDRRLYFPSEGSRAEDFFALKNLTALAVFEPSNLGTKGHHATPRPPKPL
jgi:hypothetical protein